jgi:hypothetical protein
LLSSCLLFLSFRIAITVWYVEVIEVERTKIWFFQIINEDVVFFSNNTTNRERKERERERERDKREKRERERKKREKRERE